MINPMALPLRLLDQIALWANYKVRVPGAEEFTVPLGLVGMLAASLLLLVVYSVREFREKG